MAKLQAASAQKLPKVACIGEIADVGDTKASKSGTYNVTNIAINPLAGGIKTQFSLLTRPEWLVPGFNPDVDLEGNNSALFVYRSNIMGPPGSGVSRLIGLTGSEAASELLVDDIFASVATQKDEEGNEVSYVPDEKLTAVLRKHTAGKVIGYVLKQKEEDTGELDEANKKIKIRTNNYEVDQLFFADEKALAKYRKLATERPDDWRVAFE